MNFTFASKELYPRSQTNPKPSNLKFSPPFLLLRKRKKKKRTFEGQLKWKLKNTWNTTGMEPWPSYHGEDQAILVAPLFLYFRAARIKVLSTNTTAGQQKTSLVE